MAFNRGSIQTFKQERLAKEDIRLLREICEKATESFREYAGSTRIELLIGKLKRMEKAG